MSATSSILSALQVGEPTSCNNLSLVPLLSDVQTDPTYITLEKGLASSKVDVQELEDGASVSDILLRNLSDDPVLLFEGEELLGAMQNRILNVSILVSPKTKQVIPVSCVEAGRWHHRERDPRKRKFSVANRVHYARGRALENRAVSMNLHSSREYRGNQGRTWSDIDEKSARLDVSSESSAADAMYVSTGEKIEKFVESFKHVPDQIGSVFVLDGQVSGLELYSSQDTHAQMLPRLVRSYALDAIDSSVSRTGSGTKPKKGNSDRNTKESAEEFLARIGNSWTKRFNGVCLGENVRFTDERLTGSALEHEDRVLHLSALALSEDVDESPIPTYPRRSRPRVV